MHDERIEIRVPSELKKKIEEYAKQQYTSQSEIIRQALVNFLKQNSNPSDSNKA